MIRRVYIPPSEPIAIWRTDRLGSLALSLLTILLSIAATFGVGVASLI